MPLRMGVRTVYGEVLVAHEPLGVLVHLGEELLCHLAGQQLVAVLRERRMVPRHIVHAQTNIPAKQQVVIDLLDQQTLRTHRVEDLKQ